MAVPVALIDPFVGPVLDCLNPDMPWPSLEDPGLPNFLLGLLSTNMAAINFFLDLDLTDPKLPTLDLFISAFGLTIPGSFPDIEILGFKVPGFGEPPPAFDLSGLIKLMTLFIVLPFELITAIIGSIPAIKIPGIDDIIELIFEIGLKVGLPIPTLELLAGCLAKAVFGLFSSFIPA
jgi:hypothetical protein